MTEQTDGRGPKPDGSAYAAHLANITERNAASKKTGKARRAERELVQARDHREAERRQEAGLKNA
jgi:anti-sigma factor RsiW